MVGLEGGGNEELLQKKFQQCKMNEFQSSAVQHCICSQQCCIIHSKGLPCWLSGKESVCSAGGIGSIPGLGRSPGERNGNRLQHSCLGNPMDRITWRATVHEVTKESDMIQQLNNNNNTLINLLRG